MTPVLFGRHPPHNGSVPVMGALAVSAAVSIIYVYEPDLDELACVS
ncbi:MAG: hypothetical protein WAW17_00575 [Rhodococcus sp. (in: high G+C Gram-positive bacteria)]